MFVPKFVPPWRLSSCGSYPLHLSGMGYTTASNVTAGLISVFLELISLSTRARWRYTLRGNLRPAKNYPCKWPNCVIFHVCLFLFSLCFWQPCAHHQENCCINATPGLCHSLLMTVWYAGMRFILTCKLDGHLHRVTQTRCRIDTIIILKIGTWLPETCRE